ncbi:MAG: TadG family pilus assembly protein [Hyphomonadaceae bacterium]
MFRSLVRDRRGSVITVFAFSTMVLAVMTAVVMNQVSFYMAKRKLQSAVDMATLMIMESGNISVANAKSLIENQLGETVTNVKVTQGTYSPDAGVSASGRFIAHSTPTNAVEVTAEIGATKVMLGSMLPDGLTIDATARAARRTTVSVVMGSRLVRVEGGLSAALLDATLGYKGKLTVMDYNSLASAQVDVGDFLRALNTEANIQAVTFDDVLSAPVSVKDVLDAMIATTSDGNVQVLLKKASPASGGKNIIMNDVLDLGSMTGLPVELAPVGAGDACQCRGSIERVGGAGGRGSSDRRRPEGRTEGQHGCECEP